VYYSVEKQKILSEEELQVSVELRDSLVTKADISNFGSCEKVQRNYPGAKLLIWTEDCWKLQGAKAVTFNPDLSYLLVKYKDDYLIVAEKRLNEFIARVANGKSDAFKTLLVLAGSSLQDMTARNPLTNEEMRLIPATDLKPTHGSGLHTVTPAHGIHDLKLSYMH
jgi:isoleucyl-tRNA synthetase